MLTTNDGLNVDSSPTSKKQKRVRFSSSGNGIPCLTVIQLTFLALNMSEKHESNPSLRNGGEFRDNQGRRTSLLTPLRTCHAVTKTNARSVSLSTLLSRNWLDFAFNLKLFRAVYEKDSYDQVPPSVYQHGAMDPVLQERNTRWWRF